MFTGLCSRVDTFMKWQKLVLFFLLSGLLSCNQDAQTHAVEMSGVDQQYTTDSELADTKVTGRSKSSAYKHIAASSTASKPVTTKPITTKSITTKPRAAVMMTYEFDNDAVIGEYLDIKLNFKTSRAVESLQVEYHIESGLAGVTAQSLFQFQALAAADQKTVVLTVLPEQEGQHLIHVYATLHINGQNQSRSFIVPVAVQSDEISAVKEQADQPQLLQQKRQNTSLPKGMHYLPEQNVISMPAKESSD